MQISLSLRNEEILSMAWQRTLDTLPIREMDRETPKATRYQS